MTTSEFVCLFHNFKYSCNLQQILNLLRADLHTGDYDINQFARQSLCICELSSTINEEAFNHQKDQFDELQNELWYKKVNPIIEKHIIQTDADQICISKLYQMIYEMYQRKKNFSASEPVRKTKKTSSDSFRIRQRVELTVPATQLGHLLGAEGRRHKEITERTNTRIHFDNAPYTSKSKFSASPRFDLDAFQSAAPLRATMSGSCKEDVQNAIEDLQSLDRATKENLSE